MSGVALLPLMIFPTAGAMIAGRAMLRLARYRFVPIVGMVVSSLSLAPMILAPADAPLVAIEIILTVIATGVGMMFPVSTVSTQNAVAPHELGTAMALVTFARNLGSVIPFLVGAAVGARVNWSETEKLGVALRQDLRRVAQPPAVPPA